MQTRSTNQEDFLAFLKKVKASLRNPNGAKPYLVLDNHPAHKAKSCRTYLEEHFIPLWMPAGTPQFNSIESLWSPFKGRMKKELLK